MTAAVDAPRPGTHYPRSEAEFHAWFRTEADCLDYLEWLRWPAGFVCPACGNDGAWRLADGRFECSACGGRTSVTAATIFDRTRTPLRVWFTACWVFANDTDAVSALGLKRRLKLGSYQTAWAMLHRLRSVLVRPGRDGLAATVENDDIGIGGREPRLSGSQPGGREVPTGITVESRGMVFYRLLALAVRHGPLRYGDIIAGHRPRAAPQGPRLAPGTPPTLERPPANRPWRTDSGQVDTPGVD